MRSDHDLTHCRALIFVNLFPISIFLRSHEILLECYDPGWSALPASGAGAIAAPADTAIFVSDKTVALDLKAGARKILRVKAMWVLDGHAPAAARTLDLGTSGVSVHVEQMVKEGAKGQISFEMFTDGKTHMISAKVAVTYCIFSSGEFKVGMQFLQLDPQTAQVLSKFMR